MYAAPLYNEKELLCSLAKDDAIAFESLYSHYDEALKLFLLRYVKSPELSEDLSQEIFGKIWEARFSMGEVYSFRAYLFTVARNHTLNFLARASKINAAMAKLIEYVPRQGSLADDALVTREYKQWLQHILNDMSPQMRQVFQLVRQEQKSYDEVAAIMGISRNTVKMHMVRSVRIIKGKLDGDPDISFGVFLLAASFL